MSKGEAIRKFIGVNPDSDCIYLGKLFLRFPTGLIKETHFLFAQKKGFVNSIMMIDSNSVRPFNTNVTLEEAKKVFIHIKKINRK